MLARRRLGHSGGRKRKRTSALALQNKTPSSRRRWDQCSNLFATSDHFSLISTFSIVFCPERILILESRPNSHMGIFIFQTCLQEFACGICVKTHFVPQHPSMLSESFENGAYQSVLKLNLHCTKQTKTNFPISLCF